MNPVAPLQPPPARWPGALVWLVAWVAMAAADGVLDLANLALVLVLAAALAALWWPPVLAIPACALAVLAFNVAFVPPRGTLSVDLHQHALLLVAMLAVSSVVAGLVAGQRRLAAEARALAGRVDELRRLGDDLRGADDPLGQAPPLQQALGRLADGPVVLLLAGGADEPTLFGAADADQAVGLRLCLRERQAFGPGTGRHEDQPGWYLPLRGRAGAFGAAFLPLAPEPVPEAGRRAHAQALCDQFGLALERAAALRIADVARQAERAQALRTTLLAAIAHDHRTPLATILGAAGALHDQAERLDAAQRRRLAATIVDEAEQLNRLVDNTLQLARLGTPGDGLSLDWESAEELVGAALHRARRRAEAERLKARVEPGLPLLRCDALRVAQLLDNLVDNALVHGGGTPVEIVARKVGDEVVIAVRDRGPGVPPAERERIFDAFERGPSAAGEPGRRGAGLGLAVCRAIAEAHGGRLRYRPRAHGGASFEFALAAAAPPEVAPEAQA